MRKAETRLQPRARQLRREMTDTERRLWHRLRDKQVDGHRFRRQAVIRPYIVDFLCLEKKLIVELDGGQHQDEISYDQRRDDYLASRGFRVLRFWNNEVNGNMEGVLMRISEALASPHPNPLWASGPSLASLGTATSSRPAPFGLVPLAGEGTSIATDNSPSSACGGGLGRGDTP